MRVKISLYCFIFFFLFFSCNFLFAQQNNYREHTRCIVKTINIEDGLRNNSVQDIITDAFGFGWVSTITGLQRYDGYRLETVEPVIGKDTLKISYAVFFLKLKNNSICISCKDGIILYNPYFDKFTRFTTVPLSATTMSPLIPVEETDEGIWCMEQEKGFVLYDYNGKFVRIGIPDTGFAEQMNNTFRLHIVSNDQYTFLQTDDRHIIQFDKRRSTSKILTVSYVQSVACSDSKLYILNNESITMKNIEGKEMQKTYFPSAFSNNLHFEGRVIFTRQHQLLFSVNNHLLQSDTDFTNVQELTTLNDEPILRTGFLLYIYPDPDNRIWLLSNDDIHLIQNSHVPFQGYAYPSPASNFIRTVFFDNEKKILLAGCFNGGIQLYDSSGKPLWKAPLITNNVKDILSIVKISDDKYLIVTIGEGLYFLHLSSKKFSPVYMSNETVKEISPANILFSNTMLQTAQNDFIISSSANVLQFSIRKDSAVNAKLLFRVPSPNITRCLAYGADKSLWIGSAKGILYHVKNGNTKAFPTAGNYAMRSITIDINGNVWTGTEKGLFMFSSEGKLLKTFTNSSGLLNDCIYSLVPDEKTSSVYAGSNLGLSYISSNGAIKNFTKDAGLQGNEFNTLAAIKNNDGKYFFGGLNGISAFYPSDIFIQDENPSIVIYKLNVNEEKLISDSAVWSQKVVSLKYNQNKINISLTVFGQQNASAYTYEYKMNNYDKNWIFTNNAVDISYNLPPGEYQFEARLKNMERSQTMITIIVDAPFWRSWWFYLLAFIAISFLLFILIRAIYQTKYRRQVQHLLMQQQIFTERERISRDLHDNIGAYATAINANVDEIMYEMKAADNASMQRLKDSAREIIVHLRDSIWALNKENQTVEMLGDRIKNYIQKLQPFYAGIVFDVQESISNNVMISSIKALNILRIVQEAIHNAVRHSGCNNITVIITSGEIIKIEIADNGEGISEKRNNGEGIKNMKLRAEEIHWNFAIENIYPGCLIMIFGNARE